MSALQRLTGRVTCTLLAALIAQYAAQAQLVRAPSRGEAVERHLPGERTLTQWVHDPNAVNSMSGDRFEQLAIAMAAAYLNITIAHIEGGDVTGSIDESVRHAITKLAHFHFPSTKRSGEYLRRMGERADSILGIGCPSSC